MSEEVDDRKDAQQTWSELQTIYNEAPIGLAVIDTDFRFRRINARLAEINGVAAQDHIGRTIREVVPALGDFGEDLIRRIVADGEAIRNIEVAAETPAQPGAIRSFVEHWSPLKNDDGKVIAVNVVVEEVTERKSSARSIAEGARRLSVALRIGRLGVFEQTLRPHSARNWDRWARRIWGIPADQDITDDLVWSLIHPDDLEAVRAFRKNIDGATTAQHFDAEYRIFRFIDKAMRWISVSLEAIIEDGKPSKLIGIVKDVTEAKQATERDKLLAGEVNHRAKNLLAVVQAIAEQTSRAGKSANDFAQEFNERLMSLSNSHDLIVRSDWRGTNIAELISSQLFQSKPLVGDRILMTGPQLIISPRAAQDIGMAMNELANNARKYGALSNLDGCVLIGWDVSGVENPQFEMSWIEYDGPKVASPKHDGFGTRALTRILQSSLSATTTLDYPSSGLQWTMKAPKHYIISP